MKHKIPNKVRKAMQNCAEAEISESWGGNAAGYDVLDFLDVIAEAELHRRMEKRKQEHNPVDNTEDYEIHVSQEKGEPGTDRLWLAEATVYGQKYVGCELNMHDAISELLERIDNAD